MNFSPRLTVSFNTLRMLQCRSFRKIALFTLPAALLGSSLLASADTVTLKNGDHLTGTVTQLTGGKITVHTDYAGDVAIAFDQVTNVKMDKPIVLSLEIPPPPGSKKSVKPGVRKEEIVAIDRTGTGFTVTPAGDQNAPQPVATAELTTLRTAAAQTVYEASLHPGWLHAWAGAANVSFALARGNSNTTTIGTGVNAVRATSTDKTSLYYNEIYTHDGIAKATTANNTAAGARYDHNLLPKVFAFGTGDFATDALQELSLRTVLGGGLGWHAYNKPKQQFDVLGGVVWTREHYDGFSTSSTAGTPPVTTTTEIAPITNSFAALDFGETYNLKLGPSTAVTQQGYFFPDLQDTGQYRSTFNLGLSTKLKSFLSWQSSVSDVFVSNPPVGTKNNDFILTTGLGFNFTRK